MKKTLLICLLFIVSLPLFSQDSLLRKFKFRNVNYRAITIGTDGNVQFNRTDVHAGRNESHGAAGSFGGNYYHLISTDRILFSFSGYLATSFYRYKADNITETFKNRSFQYSPELIVSNKWFSKNNFFTELGAGGRASFGQDKFIGATESENEHRRHNLSVTAGIGKGRLENVTDMQNALWLVRNLASEGQLSRSLSPEELNALGRAITVSNNTRVLDARRRTRFILESVDKYLQDKGLISKTDIKYFGNLNDILFFAFNNGRLSGTEKFIRITPGISYVKFDHTEKPAVIESNEKTLTKSATLSVGINRYLPSNLKHQNNFGAAVSLNYFDQDYNQKNFYNGNPANEVDFDSELKQVAVRAFFEHAIYPNTRTTLSFKLEGQGGYQDLDGDSYFGSVNLQNTATYFISYRTRFNFGVGAVYRNNVYATNEVFTLLSNNLQVYANVGLLVSL